MSFNLLLLKLLPLPIIEIREVETAFLSAVSEVFAEVRLSITLGYLAGGIFWDIPDNFGVSVGEYFRSVFRTVDPINHTIKLDWDLMIFID